MTTETESVAPWGHGRAECFDCQHVWMAAWPLGADALECPKCGGEDTVRAIGGDE